MLTAYFKVYIRSTSVPIKTLIYSKNCKIIQHNFPFCHFTYYTLV